MPELINRKINEELINNMVCPICKKHLEFEDIQLIHIKHNKRVKNIILNQKETINRLEMQLANIKDELRTCYKYKDKIEEENDKSKEIILNISRML